jgi:hypothetical protein
MPRLTKRWLDAWRPEPGRDAIEWDDQVPGFGIRAYPGSARRAWLIQYRAGRATRRHVLGAVGALTPDQARRLAREKLASVAAGHDPSAERRACRQAETVGSLCDRYLELHAKPRKRSWRDDQQRIDAYLKPRLGSVRARDVTRADARALHRWIGQTVSRFVANRTLALFSHLFNWGGAGGFPSRRPSQPGARHRALSRAAARALAWTRRSRSCREGTCERAECPREGVLPPGAAPRHPQAGAPPRAVARPRRGAVDATASRDEERPRPRAAARPTGTRPPRGAPSARGQPAPLPGLRGRSTALSRSDRPGVAEDPTGRGCL